MKQHAFYLLAAFSITLFSCQKEPVEGPVQPAANSPVGSVEEYGMEAEGRRISSALNKNEDLKIVTFNVHGATKAELIDFRDTYLDDDVNIICLQEVDDRDEVLEVFQSGSSHRNEDGLTSFPYFQRVENYTQKNFWGNRKYTNLMVLSKFPIVKQSFKMVQQDPNVDRWYRHAQYVRLKVNNTKSIDLFHYHNTYDPNHSSTNFQYEKSGMTSFKSWVESIIGTSLSTSTPDVYLTGDFNLGLNDTKNILGTGLDYAMYKVDYVVSTDASISSKGQYNVPAAMSDHNPVWAEFSSETTNRYQALKDVVRMYEHSNFTGRVASFEVGTTYNNIDVDHNVPEAHNFWNDEVSSIRKGGYVNMYAWADNNKQGTKWCFSTTSNCGISNYNDKFSSVQIY